MRHKVRQLNGQKVKLTQCISEVFARLIWNSPNSAMLCFFVSWSFSPIDPIAWFFLKGNSSGKRMWVAGSRYFWFTDDFKTHEGIRARIFRSSRKAECSLSWKSLIFAIIKLIAIHLFIFIIYFVYYVAIFINLILCP